MGSNGIVKERAVHNVNHDKFSENHEKIFGERVKIACRHCDLSSRQKLGHDFTCPHCNNENKLPSGQDFGTLTHNID